MTYKLDIYIRLGIFLLQHRVVTLPLYKLVAGLCAHCRWWLSRLRPLPDAVGGRETLLSASTFGPASVSVGEAAAAAGGSCRISVTQGLESGFIFGHLARNPHLDNVSRRHGYSWGPSGFCQW